MNNHTDMNHELRAIAKAHDEADIYLENLTESEIKYLRSNQDLVHMIMVGNLASVVVSYENASLSEKDEIEATIPDYSKLVSEIKPGLIEIILDFASDSIFRQLKAPFKLQRLSKRFEKSLAKAIVKAIM